MDQFTHALVINALPPAPAEAAVRPIPLGPLSLVASAAAAGYRIAFSDPGAVLPASETGGGSRSRVEALAAQMEGPWPLVAVSCMSAALPLVLLAATRFRAQYPEPLIVLGGAGPSAVAREIMELFPAVDAVCSGPGEEVFPDLVAAAWQARSAALRRIALIPGLWVREGKRVVLNHRPSWREMPQETRRLVPTLVDRTRYAPAAPLVTSFGCLYMCDFCTVDTLWPRPVFRLPEDVVQDVLHLSMGLGYKAIDVLDDSFTLDETRLRAILDRLRTVGLAGPGRPLTWSCQGRADRLTEPLLDYMAESGCREVNLGVESGSARVLRVIRKGIRVPEAVLAIRQAAARMRVNVSLLFGFPYESFADFDDTRRLFFQLREMENVVPTLHLVTPYADSPLFDAYSDCLQLSPELLPLSFDAYEPGPEELALAAALPELFPDFSCFVSPDLSRKAEVVRQLLSER